MKHFNNRKTKLAWMILACFAFTIHVAAFPLEERHANDQTPVAFEKASAPGPKVTHKKSFPWLWVIGGAVAVGVVLFLVLKKNSDDKDPDLELEWLFAGNSSQDTSGKNRNGTVSGATVVADRKGASSAYSFNGINSYISGPNFAAQKNNQVSVSLWIKTVPGYQYGFVLGGNDFAISQNNQKIGMTISIPSTTTTFADVTADQWTHIVGTFDGQTIQIYKNGAAASTKSHMGSISNPNRLFEIGRFSSSFWKGAVDDIRIYSRVLSQADITNLYNE